MSDRHDNTAKPIKHEWLDLMLSPDGPHPMTRFVLAVMARWCALDYDTFWVAQRTLVEQTGLGESTVRRRIADAIDGGWLERLERGRSLGHVGEGFASTYRLKLPVSVTGNHPVHQPVGVNGNPGEAADQPVRDVSPARHSDGPHAYPTPSRSSGERDACRGSERAVGNDEHTRALQQLERLQTIDALEQVDQENLEELERIEADGMRVNGVNLADQAQRVRQRIMERGAC